MFDFGQTLFQWRGRDRVPELVAEGVAQLLGWDAAAQAEIVRRAQAAWPASLKASGHPMLEIDLVAFLIDVFRDAGRPLPYAVMDDLVTREHLRWDGERELHPAVLPVLRALKAHGIKVGVLSNSIDPPQFLARDLKTVGIDSLVDVAVSSSMVGARKPNPVVYRAVLERLGCEPGAVLFVGDRVLEDVRAPQAMGMHAALATWFRDETGAVQYRLASPHDVLATLGALGWPNPGLEL